MTKTSLAGDADAMQAEAKAVAAAARILGIPLESDMAERIAAGAKPAVAAVSQAMAELPARAVGESADYLGCLESLAEPVSRTAAVPLMTVRQTVVPPPKEIDDWLQLDLCSAHALLLAGGTGCQDLIETALQRATRMQPTTAAWLQIDSAAARARASWLETLLGLPALAGSTTMPLLGMPLAHKDMFNLPGRGPDAAPQVPSCGSRVVSRLQSPQVATVISRLEQAGAVNLGTLNMAEFALGATGHNAARGDCANAWDPQYISGGSSSGSAVAVAGGAVYASLGSDTGGSVRIPASVNGLYGLKPTFGLVPRTGSMKLAPSIDVIGPMARSARDLARVLAVIAGSDQLDPLCSHRPVVDYEGLLEAGVEGLRIGLPDRYFFEDLEEPIRCALERTRLALEAAGAKFTPVELPDPAALAELSRAVVYAEATGLHAAMLRDSAAEYSPQVRLRASTGLGIPAPVYLSALSMRLPILERFVRRVFANCDALFTPTIPMTVPRRDATDVGAGEALWPILSRLVRCTAPFNFLGLPAITVPAGFDAGGMPIGAQFVAKPFAEALLLRIAAAQPVIDRNWPRW